MQDRVKMTGKLWKIAVMIAVLLFIQPMQAQNITGEIDGRVTDVSGAVVPGAVVKIVNAGTKALVRTVRTNGSGDYTASLLQVGTYNVGVTASGFKTANMNGIQVDVGSTLAINFKLTLGQFSDSVTVSANPEAINVETPEGSSVIDSTEMTELALDTRNFEEMLLLQPGVSSGGADELYPGMVSPGGQSNHPQMSINGLLPNQLTWLMDGADMLNHGGSVQVSTFPSVDAIQQIKSVRNSYGAQYGGGGSAQVLLVTKSGGSAFHGGGYFFWRDKLLNATPFFAKLSNPPQAKPPIQYNDFGYSIGGPMLFPKIDRKEWALKFAVMPKTYFFFSQEFRRITTFPMDNQGNYPAIPQANGYFANPVCIVYTYTGTTSSCKTRAAMVSNSPYPGYSFQVPTFDPIAQQYLTDVINPALAVSPPNSTTSAQTLSLQQVSTYRHTQELFRLDHQFSERFSAFVRYIFDPIYQTLPNALYKGNGFPGVGTSQVYTYGENFMVHGTWTATPNTVLDMGYSYGPYQLKTTPIGTVLSSRSPDVNIPLPFANTLGRIPSLSINGDSWSSRGPYRDLGHTVQLFENTTKQVGRHTLYFGVNYEHYYVWTNSGNDNSGSFTFTGGGSTVTSGGVQYKLTAFEQAFTNFLIGNPSSFTQSSIDGVARDSQSLYEAYIQDNWRVSPRLTLNLGLRYSIYGQPYDRANHLGGFQPEAFNASQVPAIGTSGTICRDTSNSGCGATTPNLSYNPLNGIVQAGPGSPYGAAISRTPLLNFAPRFGFAWDVFGNGKTSLRAGYGVFYNQAQLSVSEGLINGNPAYVQTRTWNTQPISFGNPAASSPTLNTVLSVNGQVRNWRQPYTQGWSIDVQQQIGSKGFLDVAYIGNNTLHLPGQEDLNQPLPGAYVQAGLTGPIRSGITTAALNQIRPFRGYGPIGYINTRFFADYNALQATFQRRFGRNSRLGVNYTWSKSLANNTGLTQSPHVDPQNRFDLRSEWGPTALDRRNIFSARYIYHLPFYRSQNGFKGKLLGGWQISGIVQASSGRLLTVTQGSNDPAGQGGLDASSNAQRRADMVGKPKGPKTLAQFFNTSAFAQVPAGEVRPGNGKPGSVLGPGYQQWNTSLFKNFAMRDQMRLQLRMEAFNVFNHVNYSSVNTSLNNGNFGSVTAARTNRTMQLAAKFYF